MVARRPGGKALIWVAGALAVLLFISVVYAFLFAGTVKGGSSLPGTRSMKVDPIEVQALKDTLEFLNRRSAGGAERTGLLTGEARVAAVGSAYPIPFAAEVCPFSGVPQPSPDEMDRDGDGMNDGWELKYALDRYDPEDAQADPDGDGFTNLEEYKSDSDPTDSGGHPPYAEKLRFLRKKEIDFPLVFKGMSRMPDGSSIFQINSLSDGNTHFCALGENVQGIELQGYEANVSGGPDELMMRRNGTEIRLPRGEKIADPESQAELINILDRSNEIVTMGALLSLRSEVYMVLEVSPDKVVLKRRDTGDMFNIVGLTEEERSTALPRLLK